MRLYLNDYERGQGMVIIAVLLVALLAILALTIDGGLTYVQRRQAQNAADAAALAGARAMCTSGAGDPVTIAREYAGRNGIENPATEVDVLAQLQGSVRRVVVTATIPYDTFFAGVIGIDDTEVSAVAEANCYPPCAGDGVLPIAWSCTPPAGSPSDSPYCLIDYAPNGESCHLGTDPMYIIVDSDDFSESTLCQDPPPAPGASPSMGFVDCDPDDNATNDVTVLSGKDRSWLNLDGGNAGPDELKDWIINGFHDFPLTEHMWFQGTTGLVASAYKEVTAYLTNRSVFIPVFDAYCPNTPGISNPSCSWHTGLDEIKTTPADPKDFFHIRSFAMFHITCVDSGNDDCTVHDAIGLNNDKKTIEGCFIQMTTEGGSGLPGQCSTDVGAYVLKLVR